MIGKPAKVFIESSPRVLRKIMNILIGVLADSRLRFCVDPKILAQQNRDLSAQESKIPKSGIVGNFGWVSPS